LTGLGLVGLGVVFVAQAAAHSEDAVQLPLLRSKIVLVDGASGKTPAVSLSGKWKDATPLVNPTVEAATLRVFGGTGADTGAIRLLAGQWTELSRGKGWKYDDPSGAAGGVKRIELKVKKRGGKIKVVGSGNGWSFETGDAGTTTPIMAVLAIGDDASWCAEFAAPARTKTGIKAKSKNGPAVYGSTWEGVQGIFERRGCLQAACHGSAPGEGALDLRPEVAYAALVEVPSERGGKLRIQRGSRQDSFLWEKLAAATSGYDLKGRGSPMPIGTALSPAEVEAVRLWIQSGAPETGVVLGTENILGSCAPPAEPVSIAPATVPAAEEGLQFHAPPWTIPPAQPNGLNGEGEVCYATYFNVTDRIPAEARTPCPEFWGGPSKNCYFFNRTELTQDPNSHHSIIHMYRGAYDLAWEPSKPGDTLGFRFQCHGGPSDGSKCDPRVADACGAGGACYGDAVTSLACIGYGPPDYSRGINAGVAGGSDNAPAVGGSQQPYARNVPPPGVFGIFPAEGVIVWNSHAFNLFEEEVTNQQWWNVYYASATDRSFPARQIFDATDIFVQNVPPYDEREYCRTITMPVGTRIFELSSHTHERGRLFRVWGPGIDRSCRSAMNAPEACLPEPGAPIMTTTEYNDPTVLNLNDSMFVLDDPDPTTRRFKFCSIFDNGATDLSLLKRNSTSPIPPQFGNLAPGGKCYFQSFGGTLVDGGIACVDGPRRGLTCGGDDSACDSAPGAGDGVCDACPLVGGVTTDDEMFILLGTYYCEPGSDCEAGVCVGGPNRGARCDGNNALCPGSSCGPYTN
jgi:hypothetical protein